MGQWYKKPVGSASNFGTKTAGHAFSKAMRVIHLLEGSKARAILESCWLLHGMTVQNIPER